MRDPGASATIRIVSNELGPLEQFLGHWEGNVGVDVSYHNKEDETAETTYFEKAWFKPIPIVENGQQTMHGVNYSMTAWRHGEEHLDPFHDEVGYFLWEPATHQVMRCFAVPRGLAILAGATAQSGDTSFAFAATPGESAYGMVQNKYLYERARCEAQFVSTFAFEDSETLSYTSDLTLNLQALGQVMHHTDKNTLHRTDATITQWPHTL